MMVTRRLAAAGILSGIVAETREQAERQDAQKRKEAEEKVLDHYRSLWRFRYSFGIVGRLTKPTSLNTPAARPAAVVK